MCEDALFEEVCSPETSRRARLWLSSWLAARYLPSEDLVGDALVVLSELVTNAVAARSHRVTVAVSGHLRTVRLEVADDAVGMPRRRDPEAWQRSGRGLGIVGAMTSAWGVADRGEQPGKTVWAQFDLADGIVAGFSCSLSL